MAIQNNGSVFVVKDRLEALEARIEKALDEAGLKDYAKQVTKEAISEVVEEIINELHSRKKEVLDEVHFEKIRTDDRLKETESKFDVAIVDHVSRLESSTLEKLSSLSKRIERLEMLVKLSLVGSIIAILVSFIV
jgi:hypothetical protein